MVDNDGDDNFEDIGDLENVVVDFEKASVARTDFAKDLVTQYETLMAAGNASNLKIAGQSMALVHYVNPFILSIKRDWNARQHSTPENRRHVLQLANSISEVGVLEPLTVYAEDNRFWITNGHCRYLAVMHAINEMGAEIGTVPIKFEDKHSSEADRIASQIVRNSGKKLNPLEMARVVKQLANYGWSHSKIAKLADVSRGYIAQLLSLHATTTPEIEELLNAGKVAPSFVARVAYAASSPEEVGRILKDAVATATAAGKKKASAKHLQVSFEEMKAADNQVAMSTSNVATTEPTTTPAEKPAQKLASRPSSPAPQEVAVSSDKKRVAKDIFRRASIREGDDEVLIGLKPADYALLRELLGIPS